ncbi:MAG: peptide chain release factor N(5)-glutamine methyltransferase [Clostridia bacterium]|nr:peptide chain release factor N(5)-glutamine methyltransferase [Clostridia bacterium]
MTVREALAYAAERLSSVTDEAGTEARLLLAELTGLSPSALRLSGDTLDEAAFVKLEGFIKRRLLREPLQYVLGEWYFMGLPFCVSPAALIPRQDTETLCEEALRLAAERAYASALDICTGTGCIAISLKKLAAGSISVEASDISPDALALARRNAEKNGAEIVFRLADLFEGAGSYDLITANPPYICDADMACLQEEVRFEPALALAGGHDGLDIYRRIAKEAPAHVKKGGALITEVGMGQAEAVAAMFPDNRVRIIKDPGGVDRVVAIDFRYA